MLKQRIITALILIPLVIYAIFFATAQGFSIGLSVILFIATLEWNNFVQYSNKVTGWIFSLIVTASFVYLEFFAGLELVQIVIYVSLLWWLLSLPLLFTFPFKDGHPLKQKPAKIIVGVVVLLSTFLALSFLRNTEAYGAAYVMYFLIIIWVADSAAYFTGRAWGKRKLIPNVSPGKSWEGVAGAIVATVVTSVIALDILKIPSDKAVMFALLTLVTVIYSIIGDLSESMFKRMVNIKDSGRILPGHGGILDRIDSLMSGLPVFLAGLWLMEKFA